MNYVKLRCILLYGCPWLQPINPWTDVSFKNWKPSYIDRYSEFEEFAEEHKFPFPEGIKDQEYRINQVEVIWQCKSPFHNSKWYNITNEWYEDMKDEPQNQYRQIYRLKKHLTFQHDEPPEEIPETDYDAADVEKAAEKYALRKVTSLVKKAFIAGEQYHKKKKLK